MKDYKLIDEIDRRVEDIRSREGIGISYNAIKRRGQLDALLSLRVWVMKQVR